MSAPTTDTERRRLAASVSLATIRNRLRTLAREMEEACAPYTQHRIEQWAGRVRDADLDLMDFNKVARALADQRERGTGEGA